MKLRLAHRILDQAASPGIQISDDTTKDEMRKKFGPQIEAIGDNCPVVIADNVVDYLVSNLTDGRAYRFNTRKDFSNLAPPFRAFFVDANNYPEPHHPQRGWFCMSTTEDHEVPRYVVRPPEWKWYIHMCVWITLQTGRVAYPNDQGYIFVDKDGRFLDSGEWPGKLSETYDEDPENNDEVEEGYSKHFYNIYTPVLATINFMNCRNIELVDATEEVGPSKTWLRRRRHPGLVYQTITIDPMKPRRKRGVSGKGSLAERSRHICRGHFRTYTPETSKGLFGRYFGTFWVPAHERGDRANGEIITTYNVKAGIPT